MADVFIEQRDVLDLGLNDCNVRGWCHGNWRFRASGK
jgi:hypothetical protein